MGTVISIGVAITAVFLFYLYPMVQRLLSIANSINQKLSDAENRRVGDALTTERSLSAINSKLDDIKVILEQKSK